MNILFISQYFHPEPFSNGDIAKALVQRGNNVDVICCVPNYPEGRFYSGYDNQSRRSERWHGVNVVRAFTIPRGRSATQLLLNYLVYPPAALFALWRAKLPRHDVTFTSMPSPIFQAIVPTLVRAFRGVPSVYWVQDIWPDSLINTLGLRNRMVCRLLGAFSSWLYRRADIVLIQSEAFRPKLVEMGVPTERIRFFPNTSPDLGSADAELPDGALVDLPPAKLRLMFAGNVGASQNLDVFVDAAARLPPELMVQWIIVGDGRDLSRIRHRVEAEGLEERFVFTGRQPMSAMPAFYQLADAMLISLKDTAIFRMTVPFKLQSYLALGKPVIGSIGGESRKIIAASGAGYCAAPENVDALVEAIKAFASDNPARREEMGQSAERYFREHYAPEKVFGLLEDALRAALPGDQSREMR